MSNTAEVFAAMGEAVTGDGGKALRRKFKGTVTFTITPGNEVYSLDLSGKPSSVPSDAAKDGESSESDGGSDGGSGVTKGDLFDGKADLRVTCSEDVMMKMMRKEIQPQQAFMKGMIQIKGKMNLAMKLTTILAATRKHLPKSKL